MIDEKRIRDLTNQRVGIIDAERPAGSPEAPFKLLSLHRTDQVAHAYSTLGASAGPLGHELVIRTSEPWTGYGDVLEAIALEAPALGPWAIVPRAIPETPFTALLCLPVEEGEEASFALGRMGSPPYAYRLVPLTEAERALAEREPAEVRELLWSACALTADRYRSCVVDVPPPSPAACTEIALERRRKRDALLALQAEVLREHGPRVRAPREPQPTKKVDEMRLEVGSARRLDYKVDWLLRDALNPYGRHPAWVVHAFTEFMYLVLSTHPDGVRLLDRAVDPRRLPTAPGEGGRAGAARRVVEVLALALLRLHPGARLTSGSREELLVAAALPAVEEALAGFDPADEIPFENLVWAAALPAMVAELEDFARPALRGMTRVYKHVARDEMLLEYEHDPRPPLLRVRSILRRIAVGLVTAYAAERRGRLSG